MTEASSDGDSTTPFTEISESDALLDTEARTTKYTKIVKELEKDKLGRLIAIPKGNPFYGLQERGTDDQPLHVNNEVVGCILPLSRDNRHFFAIFTDGTMLGIEAGSGDTGVHLEEYTKTLRPNEEPLIYYEDHNIGQVVKRFNDYGRVKADSRHNPTRVDFGSLYQRSVGIAMWQKSQQNGDGAPPTGDPTPPPSPR